MSKRLANAESIADCLGSASLGPSQTGGERAERGDGVRRHEHHLRQTLIALRSGESLSEHENPGEATVQVLVGRVVLRAGTVEWNGSPGDLLTVPDGRHALDAVEDSVIFLTAVGRTSIRSATPQRTLGKDPTGPASSTEALL